MSTFVGRSYVQEAEDILLSLCTRVYNVSKAEAAYYQIQMRELGQDVRVQAEALVQEWTGSREQIALVYRLHVRKQRVAY